MSVSLEQVSIDQKEVLRNLLEKYDYEFTQWDGRDVNELGLYGYQYLDHYWTDDRRWAYFIRANGKLAGFVMVVDIPDPAGRNTDFQVSEFFVMHKYRRSGVGRAAVTELFKMHPGTWRLDRHPANTASVKFWDSVISDATSGDFEVIPDYPGTDYDDGSLAETLFFSIKPDLQP